jgi:hypothetical protein
MLGARPRGNDARGEAVPVSRESPSYVKGMWFVAGRRYIAREHGEEGLAAVLAAMPEEHRNALADPITSDWYPEGALGASLQACRDVIGGGTDAGTLAVMEGCSIEGIHRFWSVALRVTSSHFAVRLLPVTWRHMRRGPGRLEVVVEPDRAVVRYSSFPYFGDANYRLLVLGTLRPLMRVSTGTAAQVEIVGYGDDWLDAEIVLP